MQRYFVRTVLLISWIIGAVWAHGATLAVGRIGLTVANLDQEIVFFTKVLPFQIATIEQVEGDQANKLFGLNGTKLKRAELSLGNERIVLTEHVGNPGRTIPLDSRSYDHWFQHIAIVVSGMNRAYAHLRAQKIKHVSTAPQTLPAWNKDAGGIKAFYFRDPEDHVLEIIWFPPGKGDPRWQERTDKLFLGIDHTAIVVSDTERSLSFYRDRLGMRVAGTAENYGVEQEHLNQVFGARLRITALRAASGPGIEFLEYITPPDGRPLPVDAKANDLLFWTTEMRIDNFPATTKALRDANTRFISGDKWDQGREVLVRDPDGHALDLIGEEENLSAR